MFTMLTIEGLCVFTLSKKGEKADFWGRCTHIYTSALIRRSQLALECKIAAPQSASGAGGGGVARKCSDRKILKQQIQKRDKHTHTHAQQLARAK